MKKASLILYFFGALTFLMINGQEIFAADTVVNGVNLGSCKSYFDGCNTCSVGTDGVAACTMMACATTGTPKCLDTTDTQLIDKEAPKNLGVNFKVQKFASCTDMEDVFKKFIKEYGDANPSYRGGYYPGMDILMDGAVSSPAISKETSNSVTGDSSAMPPELKAEDFSQTNIQVAGVDESEIIKTDGKYIYYYNNEKRAIYVAKAFPATNLEIVKIIKIPASFSDPEFYISGNNLTIIATKYAQGNWSYYWFNRSVKTLIINYDISDLNKLKVEKYLQIDGNVTKSRRIGKYVYVLSQSNFSFPYINYYGPMMKSSTQSFDGAKLETDFDAKKVLPKKAELRLTSNTAEQNVNIRGKAYPYNVSQNYTSKCADIEYVIPDTETLKKYNFTPSYLTLSIVNLDSPQEPTKTKLYFGDVSEIYMSLDNLYITSGLYTPYRFNCPVIQCIRAPCPQLDCSMPVFESGQNTLIHKINIAGSDAKYQASTILPGSPLNQYSMDQNSSGSFRIVTSSTYPEQYTNVFVLDKNLKTTGKLTELAKGEVFHSSRFIGDKLYLVTFKQIDPLFVIDLKDDTNPTVLGELKIPGYSTYLHPYDATHLIGIGYDTKENQWGGTVNNGLKVDLYDVSDIKNPKQQYTLSIGDQGSSSDVLNNPRLFVWNAKQKILFMPAMIFTSANDKVNPYRHSDGFQGALAIKIDATSGIKELARVTHIATTDLSAKREKDCAQYTVTEKPACQKLLNGQEYCPPVSTYVPEYCYATSPIGEYFANQIWQFSKSFISRNLYLDNIWYTISNSKIQANDINSDFDKVKEVEMK